ncbi:hypothetical protein MASR2M79_09060 [Aminivibrio sp.]
MSRITGGLFGSDLTFAVGSKASAQGRIPWPLPETVSVCELPLLTEKK